MKLRVQQQQITCRAPIPASYDILPVLLLLYIYRPSGGQLEKVADVGRSAHYWTPCVTSLLSIFAVCSVHPSSPHPPPHTYVTLVTCKPQPERTHSVPFFVSRFSAVFSVHVCVVLKEKPYKSNWKEPRIVFSFVFDVRRPKISSGKSFHIRELRKILWISLSRTSALFTKHTDFVW